MAATSVVLRELDMAETDGAHPALSRPWQEPELGYQARVDEAMHGECVPMVVTPELAHDWLIDRAYPRQRPLSPTHVRFLMDVMRRGEFQSGEVQFRRLDGKLFLVDGQHRLTAIDRTRLAQPMRVYTMDVSSEEEIARDYVRLDRNKQRNLADSYTAFNLEGQLRLGRNDVTRLGAAVQVIGRDFSTHHGHEYQSRALEQRVAAMQGWASEARSWFASIQGAQVGLNMTLRQAAVMSVGLVTLRHVPDRARGFWREVALNEGLRAGQPARALVSFLLQTGRYGRPHEGTVERAVSKCWNAYYQGRELSMVQAGDPSRPIKILGTPYGGDWDS